VSFVFQLDFIISILRNKCTYIRFFCCRKRGLNPSPLPEPKKKGLPGQQKKDGPTSTEGKEPPPQQEVAAKSTEGKESSPPFLTQADSEGGVSEEKTEK
jgi:hypothetical protein